MQGTPKCLLDIVGHEYSMVIRLEETNIGKSFKLYWCNNICRGLVSLPANISDGASNSQAQTSQVMLITC